MAESLVAQTLNHLFEDKTFDQKFFNEVFRRAMWKNDVETLKILLKNKKVDPNHINSNPIIWAAKNDHFEIVKLLLPCSDIKHINDALQCATTNHNIEIVNILLADERTDPTAGSNYALRCAINDNFIEIVKILLADKRMNSIDSTCDTNIETAMNRNNTEIVKLLIPRFDMRKIYDLRIHALAIEMGK